MNSKWHLIVSFIKSAIRITGCVVGMLCESIHLLALFFLLAEVLGVLEEVGDMR